MRLLDNLKAKLTPAKDKFSHLAQQHEGKIHHGIEKAAKVVDERTKGKYSDKIHTSSGKAKGAMERIAHRDDSEHGHGTTTPPGPPPPAS
ncbi:antitoxin [Streptomyces cadmiisoli]|uniref:antitoxin n=1 Tax=Streptomyces cadmiisoli TaxID=2184053 RepID=UPI00364F5FF3